MLLNNVIQQICIECASTGAGQLKENLPEALDPDDPRFGTPTGRAVNIKEGSNWGQVAKEESPEHICCDQPSNFNILKIRIKRMCF